MELIPRKHGEPPRRLTEKELKRKERLHKCRYLLNHWQLYLLLVAPVAYVYVFKYMPMYGIQMAFKQYNLSLGIWGSPWVGFKWFASFFRSPQFARLIGNTLSISVYQLAASLIPPVIVAIAMNEMRTIAFKKTVQMVTYMPHFLSVVIICGILQQVLSLNGMVNNFLASVGLNKIQFLGKPHLFKHIYVWSGVWQNVGYNAIIYVAALSGISPDLHEAAKVDGANIWQRIWNVDIPGMLPTAIILLIMNCGNILSVGFEKVFLLQNSLNISASDVISTYVYRVGLVNMEYSFSTAIGLFQSFVSLLLLCTVNYISSRLSETSLW
ncbi:MAG TPA: ABC transporter permease subunit [Clostridia bacterium]|nr:ABC transporter permease subunit [Clostridia bacterium]